MDSHYVRNAMLYTYNCDKYRKTNLADPNFAFDQVYFQLQSNGACNLKWTQIKSGSGKKEFLAVCIWTQMLKSEPDVSIQL